METPRDVWTYGHLQSVNLHVRHCEVNLHVRHCEISAVSLMTSGSLLRILVMMWRMLGILKSMMIVKVR